MVILNAFSANMLAFLGESPANVLFVEKTLEEARTIAAAHTGSAVGHVETAAIFAEQLGVPVACERRTVALKPGDCALLGQYRGPRLPEGCTTLPAGATIQWLWIEVTAAMA